MLIISFNLPHFIKHNGHHFSSFAKILHSYDIFQVWQLPFLCILCCVRYMIWMQVLNLINAVPYLLFYRFLESCFLSRALMHGRENLRNWKSLRSAHLITNPSYSLVVSRKWKYHEISVGQEKWTFVTLQSDLKGI